MTLKKMGFLTLVTGILLCALPDCNTTTTPVGVTVDTLAGKGTLTLTTAQVTAMNTTLSNQAAINKANDTKFATLNSTITSLTNQLNTANLSNATRDKLLTSQSLLITSLQTQNKSLSDSFNLYKKSADGAVFDMVNGVFTVKRYQEVIAALTKAGLLK